VGTTKEAENKDHTGGEQVSSRKRPIKGSMMEFRREIGKECRSNTQADTGSFSECHKTVVGIAPWTAAPTRLFLKSSLRLALQASRHTPTLVDNTSHVLPLYFRGDNLRTPEVPRTRPPATRKTKDKKMKRLLTCAVAMLGCCAVQADSVAAVAQELAEKAAKASEGVPAATKSGIADGASSPDEMGNRRPPYRLRKSDVIEIKFNFASEFDQTVSVRPDGFITLRGLDEVYAEGMTAADLRSTIRQAYAATLHDPEVTVALKDFEKPYFIAAGAVGRPGKYELRGDATVTEGVAMAGGFTEQSKHSQVVLFRRISEERTEARVLNIKQMLKSRNLAEDFHLRAGDLVYVPQNTISKIRRYLPTSSVSTYMNPTQF
jgi:polysaccharide export outer membrane protein